MKVKLTYAKETKGTWVFKSDAKSIIPTLYIKKEAVTWREPPKSIEVTVEVK